MDRKTTLYAFRIRQDTLVRLKEIAKAQGVKLNALLNRELDDLVLRYNVVRSPDKPSPEQYSKFCEYIDFQFARLKDGWLLGSEKVRARTKFDKWVASVAGENTAARTITEWKSLLSHFDFQPTPDDLQKRGGYDDQHVIDRGLQALAAEINRVYNESARRAAEIKMINEEAEERAPETLAEAQNHEPPRQPMRVTMPPRKTASLAHEQPPESRAAEIKLINADAEEQAPEAQPVKVHLSPVETSEPVKPAEPVKSLAEMLTDLQAKSKPR